MSKTGSGTVHCEAEKGLDDEEKGKGIEGQKEKRIDSPKF